MTRIIRNLHYVDPAIRKTLVTRVFSYWCGLLVFLTLPLIIGNTLANPDISFVVHIRQIATHHWLIYVMALGALPFVVKDVLRTANRTLGPLSRLRQELTRYKTTGLYNRVDCRQDDFLRELIGEINDAIIANMEHNTSDAALETSGCNT